MMPFQKTSSDSGLNLSKAQRDQLKGKILVYQKDPMLFFREVLGIDSHWKKQIEIAESVANNKRTTVASGHDVGKSFVAADIALWFLYCFPPSIVITTAPTWRQVEKVLWGEIASHHMKSKYPLGGRLLETEIKIKPKWYAIGFSSDVADSFQGFHEENVLVIVDEPSGVKDETHEQIESIMANENAKLLYIGNPVRKTGAFARSWTDPTFHQIHISCLESPNVKSGVVKYKGLVTKKWVEERKMIWGEDSPVYQSRVLGQFPTESEDSLIKLAWTELSTIRHSNFSHDKTKGRITLGVDVARFGRNSTVLIARRGRRILKIVSYKGFDLMHTVSEIRKMDDDFQFDDIVIDDNGVGGGVTDRLIEIGYKNIIPENSGKVAEDKDKFVNRRSELAWRAREALRQNEIDMPDDERLIFECTNQYYDVDSQNRIRVMSKSLMKKKGLESPDFFDAFALCFVRDMPAQMLLTQAQYRSEFSDEVHILELDKELDIGVSRFCTFVPNLNGPSFLLWYCADRKGMVYFYREEVISRVTSGLVAQVIQEKETEDIDLRHTFKIHFSNTDLEARYNLIEQLEDHGYNFDEVEYNEEMASLLIREGLRFDKTLPVNNLNHPFILFHPKCVNSIRAVKYYLNNKSNTNDPVYEAAHKAVGVSVLTEPIWLKVYNKDWKTKEKHI